MLLGRYLILIDIRDECGHFGGYQKDKGKQS